MLLVLYWLLTGRYADAVSNLGTALVFDPFDPTVPWQQRPVWQRCWLVVHLALVGAGFVFLLLQ